MALDALETMIRKLGTARSALIDLRAYSKNENGKTARAILAVDSDARTVQVVKRKYTKRKAKGGRPKGYKMSAATKAKLRASWKRRKAESVKHGAKS